MKFSEAERALLTLLQVDATYPRHELAEKAGMSASTLWRKLQDFQAAGIIRKRVTLLDAEKVGRSICVFVFVNLVDHAKQTRSRFEAFISRTPQIMESYSVTGAHDYTLIIRERSVADFERLLMDAVLAHESVATATSQLALRCQKYTTELPL